MKGLTVQYDVIVISNKKCTTSLMSSFFFSLLRQGSLLLPLSVIKEKVVHPWGPRPLFEMEDDLVVLVTLPQLHYDVIFPHVSYGENRCFFCIILLKLLQANLNFFVYKFYSRI